MMISFFQAKQEGREQVFAVEHKLELHPEEIEALEWLFDGAQKVSPQELKGRSYVGPRLGLITPWSTTATEITYNMGIGRRAGITRIEHFYSINDSATYDRLLLQRYHDIRSDIFESANTEPATIVEVKDLRSYNEEEGLALSEEEIEFLENVAKEIGRPLTDSEVFGFSQVNSEHCRHKIFNGTFVIDGAEQPESLFAMIKKTSRENPNRLLSAYKDNVAFVKGPNATFFKPKSAGASDFFETEEVETALSLKAETHNFPTTVEPFNGAATGTGGEIRDRLGGGTASLPLAGTAVYMTPYTRLRRDVAWEHHITPRAWLYQTPQELLTKASDGASDFGNKFGQPLITGSLLTFEHQEGGSTWGYDKVIMQAGGVGYTRAKYAKKESVSAGDKIIVMGGDNYRIGMGGGAVSSVNTGHFEDAVELNAVQRSNPEMQKRVANVIRAMAESHLNPILSIHDHGAGGHLNCLSELVQETGGVIDLDALPIGDPSLSAKEIISNESQERMGLLLRPGDVSALRKISKRELAPFYEVGEATDDGTLLFKDREGRKPFDLKLQHLFGSAPKTIMEDKSEKSTYAEPKEVSEAVTPERLKHFIEQVQRLESVGSKDWLVNKVDRSVSGKVAQQQCVGPLQIPLSDLGVMALDYEGKAGVATSIGHAPQVAMIDAPAGSRLAIAEALTNIVGAPLVDGIRSLSLSANWMWPCKNPGENARLYSAVRACSDFAIALGINIPTGKDSLSMTQKYPSGDKVLAPGTLIISAMGEVSDVQAIVSSALKSRKESSIIMVDFSGMPKALGGSAFYQTLHSIGSQAPDVDPVAFKIAFEAVQSLIQTRKVLSLHDISAGGLVTALLEMLYTGESFGAELLLPADEPLLTYLFAENPALLLQVEDGAEVTAWLKAKGVQAEVVARVNNSGQLKVGGVATLDVAEMRSAWSDATDTMETFQASAEMAKARRENRYLQPLKFDGLPKEVLKRPQRSKAPSGITAAIIRDKGTNGEREMAYALYFAGFDVKDVHMSDLMTGREDLKDVQLAVFCGGFSHSDVLGSAKGWAAGIKYNDLANKAIKEFYQRDDTISLGICNGCQLLAELELLYPEHEKKHRMRHNASGKFESGFVLLEVPENNSVFLSSLAGQKLGCWVAHGEGRFELPYGLDAYHVAAQYAYGEAYPANPNGSPAGIAALSSADGRHLAMMPHPERCIFPWQCGYYPEERQDDEVTPWFELFKNAFEWCQNR